MNTDSLITFFATLHTFGAIIGVATVTFAETFYTAAARDGIIDHHERKYLRQLFHGLRFGMILVLLSGVALVVLEYLVPDATQLVLEAPFWALMTLTLIVIGFASMLVSKTTPWRVASSGILVGWWFILLLDLGYMNSLGYINIMLLYVLASVLIAGVLGYAQVLLKKKSD